MAEKRKQTISNMSLKDISEAIGINVFPHQIFDFVLKYPPEDTKDRFNSTLTQEIEEALRSQPISKVLIDHEESVNKTSLILLTLYNSQKDIEKLEKEHRSAEEETTLKKLKIGVANAISFLEREEDLTIYDIIRSDDGKIIISRIDSKEIIKYVKGKNQQGIDSLNKPSKKKEERLTTTLEGLEPLQLEKLLDNICFDDIAEFAIDKTCGNTFLSVCCSKSLDQYILEHPDENPDIYYSRETLERILNSAPNRSKIILESIRENCKYIDINKLLLVLAYSLISRVKSDGGLKEFEESTKIIQKIKRKIKDKTSIGINISSKERHEYSKEDIEDSLKDLMKTLIRDSEDNLIYFIKNGSITSQNIKEFINERKLYSENAFKIMVENGLLTYEDVINLVKSGSIETSYISNITNKELIRNINSKVKEQIVALSILIVTDEKLVESVKEQIEKDGVTQEEVHKLQQTLQSLQKDLSDYITDINLYASIYRNININGKSSEEIELATNKLIDNFKDKFSDEILETLYKYGLIDLDNATKWGIDLEKLIQKNIIKPIDLKKLYLEGTITIEYIESLIDGNTLSYEEKYELAYIVDGKTSDSLIIKIKYQQVYERLKDDTMQMGEKYALIFETFDENKEEERKAIENICQVLGISPGYSTYSEKRKTEEQKITQRKKNNGRSGTKNVISAATRWKVISRADKDFSKVYLPADISINDGHWIFFLPNLDEVVIEKLYQNKNGIITDAYACATYTMCTNVFWKNFNEIINTDKNGNGRIDRTVLNKLNKEGQILFRGLHNPNNWEETMDAHFKERKKELEHEGPVITNKDETMPSPPPAGDGGR